jgi:hypothetical protein
MKNGSKSDRKSQILYFLRETTIVVIGVLIAVTLNNYKESIDNQNYLDKTLRAVKNEVIYNVGEIDTVLINHNELLEYVLENIENEEKPLVELIIDKGGIKGATNRNISLRFFVANKAELIDYELISQLSDIEETTNMLRLKMEKLVDFAYTNVQKADEDTKTKFYLYLQNVIDSEEALSEQYSKFLQNQGIHLDAENEKTDSIN